jgi:hypothetical protein
MKKQIAFLAAFIVSSAFGTDAGILPWPVGSVSNQNKTRTIRNAFGNYHLLWDNIGTPSNPVNFHNGIDILPYDGNRDVRAVESGFISDIYSFGDQYVVVIVDELNQLTGSTHGWSYGHLDEPTWNERDPITVHDLISVMSSIPAVDHMHFSWSPYDYDCTAGSTRNPLAYLCNVGDIEWHWNRVIEGNPQGSDQFIFIPQMTTPNWPTSAEALAAILLDKSCLYGAVDFLYGYCLEGIGEIGDLYSVNPVNPGRIEWTLNQIRPTGPFAMFTKYVVNFDGLIGKVPEQDDKYQLHYFRLSLFSHAGLPGSGLVTCLTNAGDASNYDGINNIQENSWQTNQHNSGSGTAQASELARYKDGLYEIQVTSTAYDNSSHQVSESVTLDNFPPNVVEALVYRKGPENGVSNTEPPILGCWMWGVEENPVLLRNLFTTTYSNSYLSANEEDRLGVVLVFSEQMEETPELWISGEWPGGNWDSRSGGSGAEFNACEWDPNLTPPAPGSSHLVQCFETGSGITGYHGALKLNITGGEDLCGNSLDADPGTVAAPRNAQGFGSGYEQGVDSSYPWTNYPPHYARQSDYVVAGSYGIEVELDEVMAQYSLIGDCPYWHGFWMGSVGVSILPSQFRVGILDFEGQVARSMSIYTPFSIRDMVFTPGYTASSIDFIEQSGAGNYVWVGVNSLRYFPEPYSIPPVNGGGSGRVFLYTADGSTVDYVVCSGSWYAGEYGLVLAPHVNYLIPEGTGVRVHFTTYGPYGTSEERSMFLEPSSLLDRSIQETPEDMLSEVTEAGLGSHPFSFTVCRNPVTTAAEFLVSLPEPELVELTVHDLAGREVHRFYDGEMSAGERMLALPVNLPSGVYLCRLRAGLNAATEKLVIVR